MKDQEIIIEVAKLDGFFEDEKFMSPGGFLQGVRIIGDDAGYERVPDYLNSRDAIIPVIERCWKRDYEFLNGIIFAKELKEELRKPGEHQNGLPVNPTEHDMIVALCATPRQLCIALLKATEKWKE